MTACSTLDRKSVDVSEEAGFDDVRFLSYGGIKVVHYVLNIIHFHTILSPTCFRSGELSSRGKRYKGKNVNGNTNKHTH
jgi:hypothetical protein